LIESVAKRSIEVSALEDSLTSGEAQETIQIKNQFKASEAKIPQLSKSN
jgi:hypothetical protein